MDRLPVCLTLLKEDVSYLVASAMSVVYDCVCVVIQYVHLGIHPFMSVLGNVHILYVSVCLPCLPKVSGG